MAATSNPNTSAIASIIHPTALAGCRPAINAPTEAHTTMTAAGNRRLGAGGRPGTTAATVRVPMAMTLMAAHSDQAPKAAIRVGILGMAASEVTSPSWAPVIPLARVYGPWLGRPIPDGGLRGRPTISHMFGAYTARTPRLGHPDL